MTIMGGFGIIGAIALMLLHDKSPKTKKQQRAKKECLPEHLRVPTAFENSAYKHTES